MRLPAVLLALALLLSGCGGSPTTPEPKIKGGGPKGYLATSNQGVQFIQWSESEGNINGQYQTLTRDELGFGTHSENYRVTGLRNGSTVNLTVSGSPLGASANFSGTLKGDTLILLIPEEGTGEFKPLEMTAANIEEYNRTARIFKDKLNRQQAEALTAEATYQALQESLDATSTAVVQSAAATAAQERENEEATQIAAEATQEQEYENDEATQIAAESTQEVTDALSSPKYPAYVDTEIDGCVYVNVYESPTLDSAVKFTIPHRAKVRAGEYSIYDDEGMDWVPITYKSKSGFVLGTELNDFQPYKCA